VLYQVSGLLYDPGRITGGVSMHARHQSTHALVDVALNVAVERISREDWTSDQARDLISRVLDAMGIDYDQRIEVLGGSLVSEAVRPYWESGLSAAEAHNRLGCNDPELAEVVEGVSTVLLARAEAQDDARALIGFLETQLLSADHSLRG
jgi:hypothetical protein